MQKNKIISLDGLDVFEDGQSIELAPLTILTGLNGSGKTAILNTIEQKYENTKRWKWPGMSLITDGIQSEEGDILLFEQPETGLHPKLQLHIADLLLTQAKAGRTVIVETHSDHIINRLLRRILEELEIYDMVDFYFLEDGSLNRIKVNSVRGFINAPDDFFSQFGTESSAIFNASIKNMEEIRLD